MLSYEASLMKELPCRQRPERKELGKECPPCTCSPGVQKPGPLADQLQGERVLCVFSFSTDTQLSSLQNDNEKRCCEVNQRPLSRGLTFFFMLPHFLFQNKCGYSRTSQPRARRPCPGHPAALESLPIVLSTFYNSVSFSHGDQLLH